MKIYRAEDYKAMSRQAANILSAQVIMKPDCVLGLATGSTPIGIYEQLVVWYEKGDLDFSNVTTLNLDEYKGISKTNKNSFYYFMKNKLFSKVNLKAEHIYIPDGEELDSEKACRHYNEVIRKVGGIDLQLLGIGHNGHIGFNEPDNEFEKETHCVRLTKDTIEANRRFFDTIEEVPKEAYTMGIKNIMLAKKIVLVASGEDKAEILYQSFYGPVTPKVQASILQLHNDVTLVADESALSVIDSEVKKCN